MIVHKPSRLPYGAESSTSKKYIPMRSAVPDSGRTKFRALGIRFTMAAASLNYAGFIDTMDPRESGMRKLYSTFPGEWHGLGLLLLRVAIGGTLILQGSAYLPQLPGLRLEGWAVCLLAFTSGTALLVGFLTPVASSLAVLGGMGITFSWLPGANWNVFAQPAESRCDHCGRGCCSPGSRCFFAGCPLLWTAQSHYPPVACRAKGLMCRAS